MLANDLGTGKVGIERKESGVKKRGTSVEETGGTGKGGRGRVEGTGKPRRSREHEEQ